jgi:hypothetical protein
VKSEGAIAPTSISPTVELTLDAISLDGIYAPDTTAWTKLFKSK